MQNLLVSFFNGFLSTLFLFILSGVVVIGAKVIQLYLKELFPKSEITPPLVEQPTPKLEPSPRKKMQRKNPKKQSAVIKSIEIDPRQVDKIYVKKG